VAVCCKQYVASQNLNNCAVRESTTREGQANETFNFSFPVDLHDYRAVTSKEFDSRLKPGTYWLAAQFTGFNQTNSRVIPGPVILAVRTFDTVNPGIALAAPPISNTLRFEVPNR
jgi:hypothetical protein